MFLSAMFGEGAAVLCPNPRGIVLPELILITDPFHILIRTAHVQERFAILELLSQIPLEVGWERLHGPVESSQQLTLRRNA